MTGHSSMNLLTVFCVFWHTFIFTVHASDHLIIKTTSGIFEGFKPHKSIRAFLGIPYAQPPIGPLRFRAPQPILPTDHLIRDATRFGKTCYQFLYMTFAVEKRGPTTGESEDCLTINIWGPANNTVKDLPTLVWIYGGNFGEGATSDPLYDPVELVKAHQDVLVASFNYRLNIFGFPDSPALGPEEKNLGLRDQRLALEWLRDNIKAFGGDPTKMTLFGQSAGSISAALHSFWKPDDPIVRAMILQSGLPQTPGYSDPSQFILVANRTGCISENRSAELECMRKVDSVELRNAMSPKSYNAYGDQQGGTITVDNVTIFPRDRYSQLGQEGKFAKIPYLIGQTDDEGDGLVPFTPEGAFNKTFADIITLAAFTCPISLSTRYVAAAGVPLWRYRYMATFPSQSNHKYEGSPHGAEIVFIFGSYWRSQYRDPEPVEVRASRYIQNAWVTFAKNPTAGLTSELGWPRYDPNGTTLVEIFNDNKPNVTFVNPTKYDAACLNIPPIDTSGYASSECGEQTKH